MRIVLDTNVLVSGLLKPYSNAGMLLRMIVGGLVQVVYDARIISEYREVLRRPKFGLSMAEVEAILSQIVAEGISVIAEPLKERLPYIDNEPFLEVAKAYPGSILVTGNKRHFPQEVCGNIIVLDPLEFLELWRNSPMERPGN
ncbi:putative toxin-antitoxin system toxin component, PIN family [Thermanaeromonas toyohensis ToBE]|uniref:Putative toxin-antitoxin system toxin component, PIN family n=1 Tax=Thermanaeromonas toyohensis ToBE TaxID=698762 RepID=A0A1W1VDR4_9FIRM|nr:putative toxin-antitoxin system toxin component, PIN family [Thermanaeromonas toyohensis]SMB91340.1 putative toxin-antitoxin system toxin component, PIN family [Thermanaeromonas toyohensis ToBE]